MNELEEHSCEYASPKFYALCGLSGIISGGTTTSLLVPLDIVKCRMQVDGVKYKGIIQSFRTVFAEGGLKGLTLGWAPTCVGYSLQGLGKFGLYEYFKVTYSNILGEEKSYKYRTALYLASSATAEFFADVVLCPFDAVKVRIQTHPGFTHKMRVAIPLIYREEGLHGFYKGIVPLWCRQISFTMAKFTCFERTIEALYKYIIPKPKSLCSKPEQLAITFTAGYISGIICSIISTPADVIVSKLNQNPGSSAIVVARKLKFRGMWAGLFPRMIMVAALTAMQWFVYDGLKVYFRLPRPPPPEKP